MYPKLDLDEFCIEQPIINGSLMAKCLIHHVIIYSFAILPSISKVWLSCNTSTQFYHITNYLLLSCFLPTYDQKWLCLFYTNQRFTYISISIYFLVLKSWNSYFYFVVHIIMYFSSVVLPYFKYLALIHFRSKNIFPCIILFSSFLIFLSLKSCL